MSKLLVDEPGVSACSAGWHNPESAPPVATFCLLMLQVWVARRRQRKALAELAETNSRLLQDIGVSQGAAFREAAKPFWQP